MTSSVWWDLTRATANVAWMSVLFSMVFGVFLSTRFLRGSDSPAWLLEMHTWLSVLIVLFTGAHVISLVLDSYVEFSVTEVVIPGMSDYRRIPVAAGIVSAWIILAVQITSHARRKMGVATWRRIHRTSYVAYPLVCAHAVYAGSDAGRPLYTAVCVGSTLAGGAVTTLKVGYSRRRTRTNKSSDGVSVIK